MFESKYGKFLMIGLAILVVIVIGVLIFFTVDYIKSSNITDDAADAADKFNGSVSKKDNKDEDESDKKNKTQIGFDFSSLDLNSIVPSSSETQTQSQTQKVQTYKGFPMSGTIEIPKINAKYPILTDASKKAIEVAVAINGGPGLNKAGNTIIIGHNYRNGTFFSNNKNLSLGDKIYITDLTGLKLEYKIFDIYTTTPEDSGFMDRETNGKREITIETCTDDAKSRLIICATAD